MTIINHYKSSISETASHYEQSIQRLQM